MAKGDQSIMVGNPVGTASLIPAPYRAQCFVCGAEVQMSKASYEAWQKGPAPHLASCLTCFCEWGKGRKDVKEQPQSYGQVQEFLDALRRKFKRQGH